MAPADGLALAALYAYPPNRYGYCGRPSFRAALSACLERGAGTGGLRSELLKFHAQSAYLSLIARHSGLGMFDRRVVRAFWLGGPLLGRVPRDALQPFITDELFSGRQGARARALCASLPEGLLPHHTFNVLFINFVSLGVPRTVGNFDSCCVSAGRVLSVDGERALVARKAITRNPSGFALAERRSAVALRKGGLRLIGDVRPGDVVSVHWGMAVEKLGARDAASLMHYTQKNIDAINGTGRRL